MSEPTPPTQPGQTVHGPQTNIAGDVTQYGGLFNTGIIQGNIVIPPPQPTLATPPAPPPDFVGRTEQLAQLAATLTAGRSAAITALHGMGGVGKTALAQQLAAQLSPHFSGGIFWANLALHTGSAESILRAWGAFCGADLSQEPNPAILSERVRGLLTIRSKEQGALLAVFDDVRAEWLAPAQLLKQSLPASTPLLLTTRDIDLAIALDAEVVRLDVLSEENARELLVARVTSKAILEPAATMDALLKHLGYLPLAIRLAAGYVSKMARKPGFALTHFVTDVAAQALNLLDAPGGDGLAATFAITYAALSAEQQRIFRYCSVYSPALLTVEHMAGLLDQDRKSVETFLDELVDIALLDWDREHQGRYLLHPLLRQYGYDLLRQEEGTLTVHEQAASYLQLKVTNTSSTPDELLESVDQWEKAQRWEKMAYQVLALIGSLDRVGYWVEIDQRLLAAQTHIRGIQNEEELSAQLLNYRGHIARKHVRWDDAIHYHEQALVIFQRIQQIQGMTHTYIYLGNVYLEKGEWNQALTYYEQSQATSEQVSDIRDMAGVYHNLGLIYTHKRAWDKATFYCEQALEAFKQLGDTHNMAGVFITLSLVYYNKGESDKAIKLCEQSLATYEQVGNVHDIAKTKANLGLFYRAKGERDKAIEYYQQSFLAFAQVGDIHNTVKTGALAVEVYENIGEWDKAIALYENVLVTLEQGDVIHHMGIIYNNLGKLYAKKGELNKAAKLHETSLVLAKQIGDTLDIAQIYNDLGGIYQAKGEWNKAIEFFEHSLTIKGQAGDTLGIAHTYINLGSIYQTKGELDKAIGYCEQALQISERSGSLSDIALAHNTLGTVFHSRKDWDTATKFYEQALATFEQIGDIHNIFKTKGNLGIAYNAKGEWNKAIDYYEQVLATFERLKDIHGIAKTYNNLGNVYKSKKEWDKAAELYEKSLIEFEQVGDIHGAALVKDNLGQAYQAKGMWDEAVHCYQQAEYVNSFETVGAKF